MHRKRFRWTTLIAIFLALGATLAVLPGCGDDSGSDSFIQPR